MASRKNQHLLLVSDKLNVNHIYVMSLMVMITIGTTTTIACFSVSSYGRGATTLKIMQVGKNGKMRS